MHEINIKISRQDKELIESTFSIKIEKYFNNELSKVIKKCKRLNIIVQDPQLKKFIDDKCTFCSKSNITLSILYSHYIKWGEDNFEDVFGKIKFNRFLKLLNNVKVKRAGGNIIKVYGLKLKK